MREELEIVQFYLFLQKERYQDKLTYEINIEDEQIKENLIPRLLIEPLVENAVSHGLEPKKESGIIRVCMYEENFIEENDEIKKQKKTSKILHIIVEDNGVGIDYEKMNEKPKEEAPQPEKITLIQDLKILGKCYKFCMVRIINLTFGVRKEKEQKLK